MATGVPSAAEKMGRRTPTARLALLIAVVANTVTPASGQAIVYNHAGLNTTGFEVALAAANPNSTWARFIGNSISRVNSGVFNGLTRLDFIELQLNQISFVAVGAFVNLPRLNQLRLEAQRNGVLTAFPPLGLLPQLAALHLENNGITAVPGNGFLARYSTLNLLDLSGNNVGVLPSGFLGNWTGSFRASSVLKLHDNQLTTLEQEAFGTSLADLGTLRLDTNQLTRIAARTFEHLVALTVLELQGNRLSVIEDLAFTGLANIFQVNLSANALTSIGDLTFAGLTECETLELQHNSLTSLSDGSFLHFTGSGTGAHSVVTGLRTLDLRMNNLSVIQPVLQSPAIGRLQVYHFSPQRVGVTTCTSRTGPCAFAEPCANRSSCFSTYGPASPCCDGLFSDCVACSEAPLPACAECTGCGSQQWDTPLNPPSCDLSRLTLLAPVIWRLLPVAEEPDRTGTMLNSPEVGDLTVGVAYQFAPPVNPALYAANFDLNSLAFVLTVVELAPTAPTTARADPANEVLINRQSGFISIVPTAAYTVRVVLQLADASGVLPTALLNRTIRTHLADTSLSVNGPNQRDCANPSQRVDTVRYDGRFSCDCAGSFSTGENCEIAVFPALRLGPWRQFVPPLTNPQIYTYYNRTKWALGQTYRVAPLNVTHGHVDGDPSLVPVSYGLIIAGNVSTVLRGFFVNSADAEMSVTIPENTRSHGPVINVSVLATAVGTQPYIVHNLTFEMLPSDTTNASFGPNGRDCAVGNPRVDTVEFDQAFSCDCVVPGAAGTNCDLQAVSSGSNDDDDDEEEEGDGSNSGRQEVWARAVGAVLFLLLASLIGVMLWKRRQERRKARQPVNFAPIVAELEESGCKTEAPEELRRSAVKLGRKLGEGQFGEVSAAELTLTVNNRKNLTAEVAVAVKTLHNGEATAALDEFLREAAVTNSFNHPNVCRLYGVVTSGLPYMLVLELCAGGDLKSYLERHGNACGIERLMGFLEDTCRGMAHLAEKNFIHRDLAARNVLLNTELQAKVSDFGLGRELEDEAYYKANDANMLLPLRWTDPVTLGSKKFSQYTDVWAFGITAIEIFTAGATPYPGWTNLYLVERVKHGYRLKCPANCPPTLYSRVIRPCWAEVGAPEDGRPTFEQLLVRLAEPAIQAEVAVVVSEEAVGGFERSGDVSTPGRVSVGGAEYLVPQTAPTAASDDSSAYKRLGSQALAGSEYAHLARSDPDPHEYLTVAADSVAGEASYHPLGTPIPRDGTTYSRLSRDKDPTVGGGAAILVSPVANGSTGYEYSAVGPKEDKTGYEYHDVEPKEEGAGYEYQGIVLTGSPHDESTYTGIVGPKSGASPPPGMGRELHRNPSYNQDNGAVYLTSTDSAAQPQPLYAVADDPLASPTETSPAVHHSSPTVYTQPGQGVLENGAVYLVPENGKPAETNLYTPVDQGDTVPSEEFFGFS